MAEFPEAIPYIGSATSHFQAEPVMHAKNGSPLPPTSDWELELAKNLAGQKSIIKEQQNVPDLPHFLPLKEKYIRRSQELGENMFRFSLDFARLCPQPGIFDEELMAEYVKTLALIRAHGHEPLLTLQHITMPRFLLETEVNKNGEERITKGAWEHPDVLLHFEFYLKEVVDFLGNENKIRTILINEGYDQRRQDELIERGLVKYFMTLSEPTVTPLLGYINGTFPPFKKLRILTARKVFKKMIKAHDLAYDELKKLGQKLPAERKPQIGIGYAWPCFGALFGGVVQKINEHYTKQVERDGTHSDFLGLNYYFRTGSPFFRKHPGKKDYGDQPSFGEIYPQGISIVLKKMHKLYPKKDIFVTEIGFAEAQGLRRPYWLAKTVEWIIQTKKAGVPIKAVLLWSMVDNFEWDLGMTTAKFGLFNEKDMLALLVAKPNRLHSWQVWQKATEALKNPGAESLKNFYDLYQKAKEQYENRNKII
ncbi:MAG: family 1 glycosylhydrolase [Candidatus Pacebacteria bacterium]|nr:family 1 glycosylhydrolase [Candidatus Paceibacterota bacterium]